MSSTDVGDVHLIASKISVAELLSTMTVTIFRTSMIKTLPLVGLGTGEMCYDRPVCRIAVRRIILT